MRKEEFAEVFGGIRENYVNEAETVRRNRKPGWHRWTAAAACLAIAVAAAVSAPRLFPGTSAPPDFSQTPVQSDPGGSGQTDAPPTPWTIYFNDAEPVPQAYRAYIQGIFTEELRDSQIAALTPQTLPDDMTCSGYAVFDTRGELLDVVMEISGAAPVTVSLSDDSFGACYLPGDAKPSVCGSVEYTVCQYTVDDTVTLAAYTNLNGLWVHFRTDTAPARLEQAKADFRRVLEHFACYEDGRPDLSAITPEKIPELTDEVFDTLAQAQAEPDFGRYLPAELPAGFAESSIRRFRFGDADYLSALWSKGLNDLSWVVSPFTEEDARRLTGVDELENYDLSLYPIPRAESVPEELREIVDDPIFAAEELTPEAVSRRAYRVNDAGDSNGWRMRFSVRYGDVVVSVSSKGVSPEWLWRQLMLLREP